MFRKLGVVMAGLAAVLTLAVPVMAAQTGSIYVTIDAGYTDVTARRLVLYRVGDRTADGYELTEEYGGGLVDIEDSLSPHLAQMLVTTQASGGAFRMVDGDNTAVFDYVAPGLYLLAEEGEDPMILPTMTAVPMGDRWSVQAYPAVRYYAEPNPETGQHPGPILGAIGMVVSGIGLAVCAGVKRKK